MTITIKPSANLDPYQLSVLKEIEPFSIGHEYKVSRGHDTPIGQLRTIKNFAVRNNLLFDEFEDDNVYDKVLISIDGLSKSIFTWQRTWSTLLSKGFIINPPVAAEALYDYVRNGVNKKGQLILPSPHILSNPIDFSSRVDGIPNIAEVTIMLQHAKDGGAKIRYITPEVKNGCVHIDLSNIASK